MFKKIFFAAIIMLYAFSSCKKEALDNATLLTTGKWKITEQTENGRAITFSACESDDTWTFLASGTGVFDQGSVKCSTSDPQTAAFTWAFLGSEQKRMTIIENAGSNPSSTTLDILELTSSVFKVSLSSASSVTVIIFRKV